MNKEKRRVPKLRFPGFTEDWEQRKLNEFLSVSNLKNAENKYNKKDVLSVSGDYGIVNQIDFQGRSFAGASVSNYGVVEKGDIVYTKSPLKLNPYGIIKTNRLNNGIVSTLYAIYKTKENCDSKFIEHYFNLDSRLNQYLKPLVNKGAKNDMKVSSENALIGEVCFPKITEQVLIADLLDCLDIYITLHQRKLNNLKLKKKALLQKLFPKNGERYPELRFPGFTDAWEQRKFNDLFKERREKTIKENEETLLSCAITGIYLNSELFSHFRGSSTIGYLKIKKYDLILSAQNLHLGNANINLFFENGMISPAYKVFELKSIDPYFINAWVKKDATKNFFLKATTEGASQCRKNIEWDVLLNQEIPVPNNLEQIAIGKFINKLDMNITLHQRKLDHLQLQKKALLQQMFV